MAERQAAMCPPMRVFAPRPERAAAYAELSGMFREVYQAFGAGEPCDLGRVLPTLRRFRLGH